MSDKKTTKPAVEATKTPVEAPKEPEMDNLPKPEPEPVVEPVKAPEPKPEPAPEPTMSEEEKQKLTADILSSAGVGATAVGGEYGNSRKSVKEMIMDYFRPTDLVKVHNPFSWHIGWAYSHPDDEVVETDGSATRRVYPGKPKTRILLSGQSVVIPGWEAYIGLTRFYKQWCQEEEQGKLTVAMSSPVYFQKFMGMVFDGVYDPNEGQSTNVELDARTALEHDLGLV